MFCVKCAANDGSPHSTHGIKTIYPICFRGTSEIPNRVYFGGRFETQNMKSFPKEYTDREWIKYNINTMYGKFLQNKNLECCFRCNSTKLIELKPNWYFRFIAWINKADVFSVGCNEKDCKSAMIIYTRKR